MVEGESGEKKGQVEGGEGGRDEGKEKRGRVEGWGVSALPHMTCLRHAPSSIYAN